LDIALDCGLKEIEFWDMTVGEVNRAVASKNRLAKIEAQERATYDYILGTLIVKGVSITLGSKDSFPTIEQAYPGMFDDVKAKQEEERQTTKDELSALRFRQFAQSYNKKFEK
jgi:hypothetical protein